MYAFGNLLWRMISLVPLFNGLSGDAIKRKVKNGEHERVPDDPSCPAAFKQLVNDCWTLDPLKRPRAQEALDRLVLMSLQDFDVPWRRVVVTGLFFAVPFTILLERLFHGGYTAQYAAAVARHLQTEHHEIYVTPDQALDVVEHLPHIYDEPFADSSQIPTYLVCKLAREQLKVVLTGDGGDEQLAGYRRYKKCLKQ